MTTISVSHRDETERPRADQRAGVRPISQGQSQRRELRDAPLGRLQTPLQLPGPLQPDTLCTGFPCPLRAASHELPSVLGATGDLIAARLLVEIGGAKRFSSDSALARHAGCAPIEVSSGRVRRHRLSRFGNRKLNAALHQGCPQGGVSLPQTTLGQGCLQGSAGASSSGAHGLVTALN